MEFTFGRLRGPLAKVCWDKVREFGDVGPPVHPARADRARHRMSGVIGSRSKDEDWLEIEPS